MKSALFIFTLWLAAAGAKAASEPENPGTPHEKTTGPSVNPFEEKAPAPMAQPGPVFLTDDIIRKAIQDTPAAAPAPNAVPGQLAAKFGVSKEEETLTRAFQEAKVPDCLHEDAMKFTPPMIGPVAFSGKLALPWWAYAVLSGHCD